MEVGSQRPVETVLNECQISSRILADRASAFLDRLTGGGKIGNGPTSPEPRQPFFIQPASISESIQRTNDILQKCESILFEGSSGALVNSQNRYQKFQVRTLAPLEQESGPFNKYDNKEVQ